MGTTAFMGCAEHYVTYSPKYVKLNGKLAAFLAIGALILCSGCGGIRASRSVSPATFLLPGFGATSLEADQLGPCETNGVSMTPALASLN